ncbi:MAG: response regulator [Huintestinicola sp.]
MTTVFCVEDDEGIRELISCALKTGGYDVVSFPSADEFSEGLKQKIPSIILLDIMLPEKDGMEILRELKSNELYKNIPVIMLTARSSELDKVNGLEAGADDYITKPFGVMELLSRVKAVLRRTSTVSQSSCEQYFAGELTLDVAKHKVSVGGQEVELTFKEFELLLCMLKNRDIVLTRECLMERVWGYQFAGESRTVDAHVKTLRQKLEQAGCGNLIQTVRGVGYKISG